MASTPSERGSGAPWTVAVLAMVACLAAIDRQSFSNLLVPIQKDLRVSDAAMGGLTGTAFSLVYAFVALPLARLADRTSRRNLISIGIAVWSVATVVCGFARSYLVLMLARVSVGAGEAGQLPAAMSLIGDLAPAQRRGTPIALLNGGSALGFASGGLIGGLLNDRFGWHVAMMVVALPGLILAATTFLTVREPLRGAYDGIPAGTAQEPLGQSLRRCARIRTLYPFVIGFIFLNVCYTGWLGWIAPFLMRVHHLTATQAGLVIGGVILGGMTSTLYSGPLTDWLARRGPRWRLYYCCAGGLLAVPFMAASTLVATVPVAFACMLAYTLIGGALTAVSQTSYLSMAPVAIRGLVTAVMNILAVGFGGGLAPLLFGAVNDVLKHTWGDQSLRYTLLIAPAMLALTCVMYLFASRTMDADVRRVSEA